MAANVPRQALPCPPPTCGQMRVYKLTYVFSPQLLSEGVTITVPALQMRKLGHVRNLLKITQTVRGGAEISTRVHRAVVWTERPCHRLRLCPLPPLSLPEMVMTTTRAATFCENLLRNRSCAKDSTHFISSNLYVNPLGLLLLSSYEQMR